MAKNSEMTSANIPICRHQIAAYILAGGRSQRFVGEVKALQILNDKTLLDHVIDRLNVQIDSLHINTHLNGFESYQLPIVSDDANNLYNGPLSGLLACMQHMHAQLPEKEWLLITPCDAPYLPIDLIIYLSKNLTHHKAACVSYENHLQPTFSIWHKSLLTQIDAAVNKKKWSGLKILIQNLKAKVKIIEYPLQTINPFMNINTKEELKQAASLLHTFKLNKLDT